MEKATKKEPAHVRAVRKHEARVRAKALAALDAWVTVRAALEELDPATPSGAAEAGKELRDLLTIERDGREVEIEEVSS